MKTKLIIFLGLFSLGAISFGAQTTERVNWSVTHSGELELATIALLNPDSETFNYSSGPINISGFDSTLGALESVTINFMTTSSSYTVKDSGIKVGLITDTDIVQSLQFTYSVNGNTYSSDKQTQAVGSLGLIDLLLGADESSIAGVVMNASETFTSGSEFENFLVADNITLNVSVSDIYSTLQLLGLGLGGEAGFEGQGTVSGYFEIVYNYSAVPEPSTYAAMFGVLALAFVAYRKRK
jgi:hypothetical protein